MIINEGEERPYCSIENCIRRVTAKHVDGKGRRIYRAKCHIHRKGTQTRPHGDASECALCGWKGSCHRHRMVARGDYTEENTRVLCPNCHAAMHGLGTLNQSQTYVNP